MLVQAVLVLLLVPRTRFSRYAPRAGPEAAPRAPFRSLFYFRPVAIVPVSLESCEPISAIIHEVNQPDRGLSERSEWRSEHENGEHQRQVSGHRPTGRRQSTDADGTS